MKLGDLLEDIDVIALIGDPEVEVGSVVYDSRKAGPGCLFAAIRGEKADGARYIPDVIGRGAAAVVYEDYGGERPSGPGAAFVRVPDARLALAHIASRFYGRPSEKIGVVGITGTNGKTTTSYLVKAMLEASGAKAGLIGTINYLVGGEVLPAPNTTPESADLQEYLYRMSRAGASHAVIEVSSHAVALKRVAAIKFAIKVFTNLTQDHLDFHGTMEDYYTAKKELFTGSGGVSVVNLDDPKGWDLVASASGGILTYGIGTPADVTAKGIELTPGGMSFTLVTPWGEEKLCSGLVGRHNVYNILAAAAACLTLGLTPLETARGAQSLSGVPGRFERVEAGQDYAVLVDYAHTEDALARAAGAAREITPGRLITLFGCGGDRDATKRPKMGYAAALLSDLVVLTSDNPRTEDPAGIIRQVEAGIAEEGSKKKGEGYFVITDRQEAIAFAVGMAGPGDTLLLAGKGHEDYQVIGETKYPFDDRAVAAKEIRKRLGG